MTIAPPPAPQPGRPYLVCESCGTEGYPDGNYETRVAPDTFRGRIVCDRCWFEVQVKRSRDGRCGGR